MAHASTAVGALLSRRRAAAAALLSACAPWAYSEAAPQPLSAAASAAFRAWFCAIVQDQAAREPSARWQHRDCAGLVRFAVGQALVAHDSAWLRAMGWPPSKRLPPEPGLSAADRRSFTRWAQPDGARTDYASAIAIVQNNTRRVSAGAAASQSADLLFFDQGAEQHLMVWTGQQIIYHTGSPTTAQDNGLRVTDLSTLMRHPDTRWQPTTANPNFAGWYRLGFLTTL